jgi:transcriptional regulator with XRE-family HTH domain
MEENKIYLSTNLKFLRTQKGITLKQVAKLIGKSDVAILYWENGSREPNAVDLGKLSTLYNVSPSDLIFKDLRFEKSSDEIDKLYNANKHLLTDEDKDMIKFIIEKRSKK